MRQPLVRTAEAPIPPALARRASALPPARSSEEEMRERRRRVMRLRMRGLGYRSIAKKLGVGHMTVKRDLEAIREDNRLRASQLDREEHVGESLSVFEEVELRAWQDYSYAPKGSAERQKFLAEIRAARQNQTKLLMDLGVVAKAPTENKITITNEVIANWSPEAQDLVALAIIKSQMKKLAEPVQEAQFVEVLPGGSVDSSIPEHGDGEPPSHEADQ
jgi:transposase